MAPSDAGEAVSNAGAWSLLSASPPQRRGSPHQHTEGAALPRAVSARGQFSLPDWHLVAVGQEYRLNFYWSRPEET